MGGNTGFADRGEFEEGDRLAKSTFMIGRGGCLFFFVSFDADKGD